MSDRSLTLLTFFLCSSCAFTQGEGLFEQQASSLPGYKVVIPRSVRQQSKRDADQWELQAEQLTYRVDIDGTDHLLHLEKNREFIAEDFVVYSNDADGKLMTSYPEVHNCYYHGHVEGRKDSLVALSTCSGLRGVIFIGEDSYGIEPALESTANEHLLYPLTNDQDEAVVCGVSDDRSYSSSYQPHSSVLSMTRLFRKKRNLPQTRYVELALVVDNNRYIYMKGNITAIQIQMVSLANLMDKYYQQLNIRIVLVGLQIFQSGNPFMVNGSAGQVLSNFVQWRKTDLLPRVRNDAAQLVVGRSSSYDGGILGMAFVGTVCSTSTGGGISVYSSSFGGDGLAYYSTIIAHELGHNLGMNHDDNRCTCNKGACIMYSYASGSTLFSNCSGNDFETLILRGGGICLLNQPSPSSIISVVTCGNGILETGEQCDCGTPQDCTNPCCDATTCMFSKGSTCAQGSCCQNCQVLVAGTSCRPSVDVCDLPEFCTGQSGFCPGDFYMMDGISCANNTAYCYEGRCQTYDYQCQRLFGSNAMKAADICFQEINAKGDRFGNCGGQSPNYVMCSVAQSMCGKVQCTNVNANFPPQGSTISVQIIGGASCVNADFGLGSDVLDPAYVRPGSSCAPGNTCMNFQCVNASVLRTIWNCNPQSTCNGNGVCNNEGNCHCNNGWGPPYCNKAGMGGSVNSGPAEIDYSLRNGLLIFFLLVVPVFILVVVVVLYVFKRDWLGSCFRKRRSRSHNSDNMAATPRSVTPKPPVQTSQQTIPVPLKTPNGTQISCDNWNANIHHTTIPEVSTTVHKQGPGVPKPIRPQHTTCPSDLP